MTTTGLYPDGRKAFTSQSLAGLTRHGRKHGIPSVSLGDCPDGNGSYVAAFGDGAGCRGKFADPAVMLGFFLSRPFVQEVLCDRTTFNAGTAMGYVRVPRFASLLAPGRFGPWAAAAYRDETLTPMVRFIRESRA
jgi:hypothetical protein